VNPGFHHILQQADRHDQHKLAGNLVLVVLMSLVCHLQR
jgi:hypothetical protein